MRGLTEIPGFDSVLEFAEGGSSTVYKAVFSLSGDPVAIKVAKLGYESRIREEARIQYTLSNLRNPHPNIVEIITAGEIGNMPYFAMELMDEDLRGIIERGELPIDRAIKYLEGVLSGLGAAHEKGVIHGDVKSRNVLLKSDGKVVKLTDFGYSRRYKKGELEHSQSEPSFGGTSEYIAPEIIAGEDPTFISDIYSLGVLVHEMFTGKKPEHGTKPQEINKYIGDRTGNLILGCLKRDPSERPQSVTDIQKEFGFRPMRTVGEFLYELTGGGSKQEQPTDQKPESTTPIVSGAEVRPAPPSQVSTFIWDMARGAAEVASFGLYQEKPSEGEGKAEKKSSFWRDFVGGIGDVFEEKNEEKKKGNIITKLTKGIGYCILLGFVAAGPIVAAKYYNPTIDRGYSEPTGRYRVGSPMTNRGIFRVRGPVETASYSWGDASKDNQELRMVCDYYNNQDTQAEPAYGNVIVRLSRDARNFFGTRSPPIADTELTGRVFQVDFDGGEVIRDDYRRENYQQPAHVIVDGSQAQVIVRIDDPRFITVVKK